MARHNELRGGVTNFAGKSFNSAHVRDYPKIFTGHAEQGGEAKGKEVTRGKEAPPTENG